MSGRVDGTPTTGTGATDTEPGVSGFDKAESAKGFLGARDPSGNPAGVFGTSTGHGVVGQTSNKARFGIFGLNNGNGGVAVRGLARPEPFDQSAGGTVGVSGEANGHGSIGIAGLGEVGVKGLSGGEPQIPFPSESHSQTAGVKGSSNTGIGVVGVSSASVGVWGVCSAPGGPGVIGESGQDDGVDGVSLEGGHAGVRGTNRSTGAIGLLAGRDLLNQQLAGAYGESSEQGVYGLARGDSGTGVYGVGKFGVRGDAGPGGIGVKGSAQGNGVGVRGENTSGGTAGFFQGNVDVVGNLTLSGTLDAPKTTITCFDVSLSNGDCAEDFDIRPDADAEPGTVMVLGEDGALLASSLPYDKHVAGVVSGAGTFRPGIVLDRHTDTERSPTDRKPIALLGKVFCKVDASSAAIEVGDLLTTSSTVGHAMKALDPTRAFGTVIGKALAPLRGGRGLLPILVALR